MGIFERAWCPLFLFLVAACSSQSPPPLAREASEGPAGLTSIEWGERLFRDHGCTGCHHINGVRGIGGALNDIWNHERILSDGTTVRVDAIYLEQSLTAPNAAIVGGFEDVMPSYGYLTEPERDALVAYIRSLSR